MQTFEIIYSKGEVRIKYQTLLCTFGARLDIVAIGLYGKNERTFMDVRITHPNAPSNLPMPVDKLLLRNEAEKKSKYASRVINTERASFIPLVFTTSATSAPECDKFHKRIAELISVKRKEQYSKVLSYIRTRISFAMLKSILVSIHGVRDKKERKEYETKTASDVAFGFRKRQISEKDKFYFTACFTFKS